ncbi:long-chain-fatty-acid--CoA ligase [Brevibacterium sp. RIT 803]|uniref:long-chain-fatty-acid--CoA ligase n=1 Tax=Brevibacterium sp. RIT 803 TaxID=2810210 RepID=UPI00194F4850|nr:long-chain-fatty-acid--CoA ligase [Brevibacterium sp. RIT 803]MBM6589809.1 long-chain-fatty-acid--CoA ligase [Brevibacterium sp. RIT 803]
METWNTELTPLSFLRRSADVFPDKRAVVYNDQEMTYREFAAAVETRAHALRAAGIKPGDRVAYLMPNLPEALIAEFAVPLAGAVLVPINTRLAPEEVRYICNHSQAKLLVVDTQLWPSVAPVIAGLDTVERIVDVEDTTIDSSAEAVRPDSSSPVVTGLDEYLSGAEADTEALSWSVEDERATLSINYTSGTTGRPKGVMYTHRGAYLNALGEVIHSEHDEKSVYLWTLPMFHCNGWCTGWALTAAGGTQVCLREVRADVIWDVIDRHRVTHLNGAPTVMSTVINAEQAHSLDRAVTATMAGAAPSPTLIWQMEALNFEIVHVYGLTETYGPYTVCEWQDSWDSLDDKSRARLRARQGVGMVQADQARIVTLESGDELVDVPADGQTIGEIVMRGNNVMKGYFRDEDATAKAFQGGWFHSGDLGVMHEDGYIELRDRSKDIIVSGGENISTVEIEQAISSHPAVLEVAVIGVPDDRWGERPKAFVIVREGQSVSEAEVIDHVRAQIAKYKAPREVEVVEALPKTSTGKIQKFELRNQEWGDRPSRIQG